MTRTCWWVGFGLLVAGTLALASEASAAGTMTVMGATLPSPRACTAAAWDGTYAYVVGGYDYSTGIYYDDVVRYDPVADVAVVVGHLPRPLRCLSAVWDGTHVVIFGGLHWSGSYALSDSIYLFDPATGTTTVSAATLTMPAEGTAAAWDGRRAYVFGGGAAGIGATPYIQEYDATNDTITLLSATLPTPALLMSAAYDGSGILLVGGHDPPFGSYGEVWRFDPATMTVASAGATFPAGAATFELSTVWADTFALSFGGQEASDQVLRYDPAGPSLAHEGVVLPSPREETSAVWTGTLACVFGGGDDGSTYLDEIVCYDPREPVRPVPAADAALDGMPGCLGTTWRLTDISTPAGLARRWTLPDGTTRTEASIVLDLSAPAMVHLDVWDGLGGADHRAYALDGSRASCPPRLETPSVRVMPVGTQATLCPSGVAGRGGALSYHLLGDWPDVAFDQATGCATVRPMHVAAHCLPVLLVEEGSDEHDAGCIPFRSYEAPDPRDTDRDGIQDIQDNCPATPNRDQADVDLDGVGDACGFHGWPEDAVRAALQRTPHDKDGDGVRDGDDLCPDVPDAAQADLDLDRVGDACDIDADGDGIAAGGEYPDVCPLAPDADQADTDGDGVGDACDDAAAAPGRAARPADARPDDRAASVPGAVAGLAVAGAAWARRRTRLP